MKSRENALVVMLRAPSRGLVKTRLVPPLTADEACSLYRSFIVDTFSTLLMIQDTDFFAAYTPAGSEAEISELLPEEVVLTLQKGKDLGDRMTSVFEELFKEGYKRVAIIGSDSPDLPPENITKAFALLKCEGTSVVFGPAVDGGYYLVATEAEVWPMPELFTSIPWGTERVLEESLKLAGSEVALLTPWHDIDRPEDLRLLKDNPRAEESARFLQESAIFSRYAL